MAKARSAEYRELLGELRKSHAELIREDAAREALLKDLEIQKRTRALQSLEADVQGKRKLLASAEELVHARTAAAAAATQKDSLATSVAASVAAWSEQVAECREEASRWDDLAANSRRCIQRLSALAAQELIRAERLRGCALAREACCLDLERLVVSRREHGQQLKVQLSSLCQTLATRKEEDALSAQRWAIQTKEVENLLMDLRRASAASEAELAAQRGQLVESNDEVLTQLRTQHHREAAELEALLAIENSTPSQGEEVAAAEFSYSPVEEHDIVEDNCRDLTSVSPGMAVTNSGRSPEESFKVMEECYHPSTSSTTTAYLVTPRVVPTVTPGAKVAALRTALRRLDQESKKELRELYEVVFLGRERLASEAATQARQSKELDSRLSQAFHETAGARENLAQHRATLRELEAEGHALEASIEAYPDLIRQLVDYLEDAAQSSRLGNATRHRQGLFSDAVARAHALCDARYSEGAFAESPHSVLRPLIVDLKERQQAEIRRLTHECDLQIFRLRSEEADCSEALRCHEQSLLVEKQRVAEEISIRCRSLWERQEVLQAHEAAPRRAAVRRVQREAEEAEAALTRLRLALRAEHAQAEKLHSQILNEQAEHRRRLVAVQALGEPLALEPGLLSVGSVGLEDLLALASPCSSSGRCPEGPWSSPITPAMSSFNSATMARNGGKARLSGTIAPPPSKSAASSAREGCLSGRSSRGGGVAATATVPHYAGARLRASR